MGESLAGQARLTLEPDASGTGAGAVALQQRIAGAGPWRAVRIGLAHCRSGKEGDSVMENGQGRLTISDDWAPKYVLDFAKTPEVRLNSEEWHAVLVALSMRFSLTDS